MKPSDVSDHIRRIGPCFRLVRRFRDVTHRALKQTAPFARIIGVDEVSWHATGIHRMVLLRDVTRVLLYHPLRTDIL